MEQKTIGSFIATLRKAKGLTQKQLAEILGVSDKTISHWERDESAPDLSILPVIADIFSVSCDELLRGEKRNCVQESTEDFSKKSEKQIKYIIEKALSKHKTFAIISCSVALLGFFVGYAVLNTRISALAVGFIFYIAAAVIIAISHSQFISKLKGDEFESELLKAYKQKSAALTYYSALGIFSVAALSVPHLLGYFDTSGAFVIDLIIAAVLLIILACITVRLKVKEIIPSKLSAKQNKKIMKLRIITSVVLVLLIGAFAFSQFSLSNYSSIREAHAQHFGVNDFIGYMQKEVPAPSYAKEMDENNDYTENRPDKNKNGLYYINDGGSENEFHWNNENVAYYYVRYEEEDVDEPFITDIEVYTYKAIHNASLLGPLSDILGMLAYAYYPLVLIVCAAVYFKVSKRIKNSTKNKI